MYHQFVADPFQIPSNMHREFCDSPSPSPSHSELTIGASGESTLIRVTYMRVTKQLV